MAITPTGAIYKTLTFDNVVSSTYGVYITGEAVYNAPEKDVEMISIPGRNGAFALDRGRFENIEVTYPAGIYADTEADFAQAVSNLRNALCSKSGYCRLTDDYNSGEYRMAIYKSGLEVDPFACKSGQFNITFECKPQRYLTSGEEVQEMGRWDVETATGPIVTFTADAETLIKDLTVDINPIQDLHGYANPWVGGAGKNLLDLSKTSVFSNCTISNGTVTASVTDTKTNFAPILQAYLNGSFVKTISTSTAIPMNLSIDSTFDMLVFGHSGSKYDIKIGIAVSDLEDGDYKFWYTPISRTNPFSWNNMMITASSVTDSTYEPYSNICPISGWDDVKVTVSPTLDAQDGTTYTVNLSGTAGTVYGGTLDVVSGELTVTHGMVDLGTLAWNYNSTDKTFWAAFPSAKRPCTLICSNYPQDHASTVQAVADKSVWNEKYAYTLTNLVVKDTAYTDAATFTTAMSGVQLVYELATPQTYQLTPTQISTLLGTNNVWADSGDSTVEYGHKINTVTNPTLFESSPLIEIHGYGDISFNGYTIHLINRLSCVNSIFFLHDFFLSEKKKPPAYIYHIRWRPPIFQQN